MALPAWSAIASSEIDQDSPVTETLMAKFDDRDKHIRSTAEALFWASQGFSS